MGLVGTARLEYNDKVSCLSGESAACSTALDNESSDDESAAEDYADFDLATLPSGTPWNIAASEFVPTNSQSLNVNAPVFTPAAFMSFASQQ